MKLKSRTLRFILGVIISVVCLYYALRGVDWKLVIRSIMRVKIGYLGAITAVYCGAYYIRSVRWHYLLRSTRSIKPLALFPHVMIGFFVNHILPMRLGEFARAYSSGQRFNISKATSSLLKR